MIHAQRFILVDPLDGTREFIQGGDEFTVNIALVDGEKPVASAVYAPAKRHLYIGGVNAYRLEAWTDGPNCSFSKMRPIRVRTALPNRRQAVVSRSHLNTATEEWISRHEIKDLTPLGSSLKFCALAAGEVDVYPRLGRTMEWDTAAGHAVLLAAGGEVTDINGRAMKYGKPRYQNRDFVAWAASPV
jgi:3'(2'), 5'-bisphosphate nucleotidase